MSSYFKDFPSVEYRFGDEETFTKFQHLGTNVDVIDQMKSYVSFYETYHIQNGERPEQLSYKLYRNTDYYWTFYLLNDHLRQGGWPVRDADLYPKVQEYYPNTVIGTDTITRNKKPFYVPATEEIIYVPEEIPTPLCVSPYFKIGSCVWFERSKVYGKILKIDQEMGLITTDAKNVKGIERTMSVLPDSEVVKLQNDPNYIPTQTTSDTEIIKLWDEFDAPHHYEDAESNWVYPNPSGEYPYPRDQNKMRRWDPIEKDWAIVSDKSTVNSVSNYERIAELNESQKIISVVRKDVIGQIVSEFKKLLKISNGATSRV